MTNSNAVPCNDLGTLPAPTWRQAGLRYYKYSHFLKEKFGRRVHRVTVDGGFTCPNVDGTVAVGGCNFCDNRSFSPARRGPRVPIGEQVERGIRILDGLYRPDAYIAYFQPATNTYAPVERLKRLYDEATADPRVIGLAIGTRPDSAPDEVLDLLESYADRLFVALEFGLQSIHRRSLDWMNRGHDSACFFDAVERTRGRGIDISAHVILGIPGETQADMFATADAIAGTRIDGVKIHNLYVVQGTPLEEEYRAGRADVLERDAYIDLLIGFLERLPAGLTIHRAFGDAPKEFLVAPEWTLHKAEFLAALDAEMSRRGTYQGIAVET